jgi:hypothetical protein
MTAARPTVVTPAFAAAITEATLDLADRIRALTRDTARRDEQDQAAKLASDFIASLCRRGWRPTTAGASPDWRSGRRQPPGVAQRGAAAARELLNRVGHIAPEDSTPGGTA